MFFVYCVFVVCCGAPYALPPNKARPKQAACARTLLNLLLFEGGCKSYPCNISYNMQELPLQSYNIMIAYIKMT